MKPPIPAELVRRALQEDLGRRGDITTQRLLSPGQKVRASIAAKERGVLCGVYLVREVFRQACPKAEVSILLPDGSPVEPGTAVIRVKGPREILSGERVALNFLQRLSGIATLTHRFVEKVVGTSARIYDTRKTTPGWRPLEKYAVRCGGGENHRMGLFDAVLVKDNHLRAARLSPAALRKKLEALRRGLPGIPIEMEAQSLDEVRQALACGVDIVLLDNFELPELKQAVWMVRRHRSLAGGTRPLIEISGGVSLDNVRAIAALGADRISVGRLTHSARALDFSLEAR